MCSGSALTALSEPTVQVEHEQGHEIPSDEENDAYLRLLQEGDEELVPFMVYASHVITRLATRAANNPLLALDLSSALAGTPPGFLALNHLLDADTQNFHEHLANFRRARIASEATQKSPAGIAP